MSGRRHGVTYGKAKSKAGKLSPSFFDSLLNDRSAKPNSGLPRVQTAKKSSRITTTSRTDEHVFDVPLSEEDRDSRSSSPLAWNVPGRNTNPPKKPGSHKTSKPTRRGGKPTTSIKNSDKHPWQKSTVDANTRQREQSCSACSLSDSAGTCISQKRKRGTISLKKSDRVKRLRSSSASTEELDELLHGTSSAQADLVNRGRLPGVQEWLPEDEMQLDDWDELDTSPRPARKSLNAYNPQVEMRPHHTLTSTPGRGKESEASSLSPKAAVTPRQQSFWTELLEEQSVTSSQGIKRQPNPHMHKPPETRNLSTGNPKRRLIDGLKSSSVSSDSAEFTNSTGEGTGESIPIPTYDQEQQFDTKSATKQIFRSQAGQSLSKPTKITYAQQRSYLSEQSQGLDDLLLQPLDAGVSPMPPKTSNNPHRAGAGDRPLDVDDDVATDAIKSIHELRIAGDSRRFDDEMSTIIDDVSTQTRSALSRRRSALMDLASRLCDSSFKSRFIQGDYEMKLFSICANEVDPICGVAISSAITLILQEPADPRSSGQILSCGILGSISRMLAISKDVRKAARDRKMNMSRMGQQAVDQFADTVLASAEGNLPSRSSLSPQLAALRAIELLLRRHREGGDVSNLLEPTVVCEIVTIVVDSSLTLKEASGEQESRVTTAKLKAAFSTLESLTIATSCATDRSVWPDHLVLKLMQAGSSMLMCCNEDTSLNCLILRLFLNLSNNNESNANLFADMRLLSLLMTRVETGFHSLSVLTEDPRHSAEFDELLLTLGTLFNLAEMSGNARHILATSSAKALEALVRVFNDRLERLREADSLAESQANVAFGYLAVLLGIICQNAQGHQRIKRSLQSQSIDALIGAIEEFIAHHKRVDREGSNEVWMGFTERLQLVADSLKSGPSITGKGHISNVEEKELIVKSQDHEKEMEF